MPSSTPKQAKTMSAIAHGWRPTGKAANIPPAVARDFHEADRGRKYGAKKKKKGMTKSLARHIYKDHGES